MILEHELQRIITPRTTRRLFGGTFAGGVVGAAASIKQVEAAADCSYQNGFKALSDRLGVKTVGGCLSDEFYDPLTGTTIQQTENGTLVWNEATNQVEFRNGQKTFTQDDNPFAEEVVKAAKDLHEAYILATGGDTRDRYPDRTIENRLKSILAQWDYLKITIDAFGIRYRSTAVFEKGVQCVGQVALALTLATGEVETFPFSRFKAAKEVYPLVEFYIGNRAFRSRGIGPNVGFKPGDIAVETAPGRYYGHIYLVRKVFPDGSFISYEANMPGYEYRVTDHILRRPNQILNTKFYGS